MTAPVDRLRTIREEILAAVDQDPEVRVWFVAKLDAFNAAVRKVEDDYIAKALREAERNPEYALHQQATLGQVAAEIEGMRR